MKSRLSGLGLSLAALASLISTASAATCAKPDTAFDKDTLKSGCCTSWITKRDVGEMPMLSLVGRDECATATCCEKKKTLYSLSPSRSDIQCGSKFQLSDQDGDTTGGMQYNFGACSGDSAKTCLSITVTPTKSSGCLTLSNGISVFIDDETVAPGTNSGGWNFGNADQGTSPYCTKKTSSSGCQYWSCEFEQSLWEGKVKNQGTDGLCGNTISLGVHFGIGSGTCTQGNTGLKYGSNFFQYAKIKISCSEVCDETSLCCCPCNSETHCCPGDTYCGGDGKEPNPLCEPECCPGQTRCDTPLCTNNPTPNCCPDTENYCGTDDHKENKECPAECCPGQTRCDSPLCKNNPTPNCCPDTENYCGTDDHKENKECPAECCPGQTRCDSPLCKNNPTPNCCPDTENYCGTDDHTANEECPAECCPGQTRCDTPLCKNDPSPNCCPKTENFCGTDDHTANEECPAECCPGQTRCDSPLCENNPTPNCCPKTENYCGTDNLKANEECPAECCPNQTRCDNPLCENNPSPNCCPKTENYCGNDGHTLNKECTATCCGGQCCDDKLCCKDPSDHDYCPQPQCQYGTGWGWMLPDADDSSHFVNKLKLCSASRWGEWFDIASLPYKGNLVVGRGNNNVANGDIVGTVSLSADGGSKVKACFDLTKASTHITSVHVEVSCNPFDSTTYINSKKKSFNLCAPGQWTYKFPPSGCLDWVHSQHDICITDIPKCSGHYYAIFHAAVTKNSDGSCSSTSGCWTDS